MSDCSFSPRLLNIHRSGCSAVWLLHGWCHVKLLSFQRKFCAHHTTMYKFTASLNFIRSHIRRMHACSAATWHLHFWQCDRDLLRTTAVTRKGRAMTTEIKVSTESWPCRRRKISPPFLPGLEPKTFRSRVRRSTTEPSPLPTPLRTGVGHFWLKALFGSCFGHGLWFLWLPSTCYQGDVLLRHQPRNISSCCSATCFWREVNPVGGVTVCYISNYKWNECNFFLIVVVVVVSMIIEKWHIQAADSQVTCMEQLKCKWQNRQPPQGNFNQIQATSASVTFIISDIIYFSVIGFEFNSMTISLRSKENMSL